MTVNDAYLFLEKIAPFKYQDSYDNSGFLIGDKNAEVKKICLALDITLDVIKEAEIKGANLIISHHPVIFKAISGVKAKTAVYELVQNDINAICAHTNIDVTHLSDIMLDLLGFSKDGREVIEVISPDGAGFGKAVDLPEAVSPEELAKKCKKAFKTPVVRYCDGRKPIMRVGVCTGAGGGAFELAVQKSCDAFITGEVKHSLFIQAKDSGITLIDAGHFHTENFFCDFLLKKFAADFPNLTVFIAETGTDFCKYIF
ncbi:MAG: Nif3-like dinuclear metal center hexameric protein [Oscillospiraceae bacterium]|nr:Nif3-like dinuclear metal center hexameric protein [Oscillospiraceae bacterium]